jgi:mono/diheme cytochrome c family protein
MPVLVRAIFLLMLTVLAVGGIVGGIASRRVNRVYDIRGPAIARATDPDEIARGGRLFRTNCLDCHAGAAGDRPIGARVTGAPPFMKEIWAPNITADAASGIGGWTDAQIARLLRNGLRRDGRYASTMPRFARLADPDVAALIGFLRSNDPLVAADPNQVPPSSLGFVGMLALAFVAGVDAAGDPQVPMPPRGPTAAYGRYLASAVYGCIDCHTDGFVPTEEKLASAGLLAGGLYLRMPNSEPIYSANLTPDRETGLATWTEAELARALSTGVGHGGLPLRPPMPVFRQVDANEAAALFAYLQTVPAVSRGTPGPKREVPKPDTPPARAFADLGCAVCHADGAPHHALLRHAATLPTGEIVDAIRNPEHRRARTQMPTYAEAVDEAAATRLATWIKETHGSARR